MKKEKHGSNNPKQVAILSGQNFQTYSDVMSRNASSSTPRSSNRGSGGSVQRTLSMFKDYGGLGFIYYDALGVNVDKIMQVDITTSIAESKGSVKSRSIKLASELIQRGITEKDIIVICSKKNVDQTIVLVAALFVGAIVAPLDPESSNKKKERLLKKLKPKMCFADARTIIHIKRMVHTMNLHTVIINFSAEDGGLSEFTKLLQRKEDEQFRPYFVDDPKRTVAFILPTQGTTGFPKLDIFNNPSNVLSFFPLSWLFHIVTVCVCLDSMLTLIIPGLLTERNACKVIQDFNVDCVISGTDYAMKLFHDGAARDFNMNCLRIVMIGVHTTTKHDINALKIAMPKVQFLCNYCLMETGCIAATKSRDYISIYLDRPTTVGSLSFNCKVKIIDTTTKEVCPPRKYGEIYYTGDGLMLGYFKDPDKTMQYRDKNYFRTGDIGMFDESGWLYVKGRFEDMIAFDEWSLTPMDIEDVILRHPIIKDAVIVGNQKEVVALVKKYPESDYNELQLRRYICERIPDKYWPSKIILQEHFPRTTGGSVKRNIIRKTLLEFSIRYSSSMSLATNDEEVRDEVNSDILDEAVDGVLEE